MSSVLRATTAAERRHDILLAVCVFIGACVSAALMSVAGFFGERQAPLGWAVIYAAILAIPLALRRRYPLTVATIVCAAFFSAASLHIPEMYAGNIAMFIALYTVGAWVHDRRRAAIVRVLLSIAMIAWLLISVFIEATSGQDDTGLSHAGALSPFLAYALVQILINLLYFGGAYYLGDRAYNQYLQREALLARTAELEREREFSAAQAVALDRVAIARELHDVVAHHVSAMGVQAGAARTVLDRDPAATRSALETIETSARTAITDLRHLLETLRTNDEHEDSSTIGVEHLDRLVAHANAAGMPTTLTVVGDPVPVPGVVGVNIYRIAQESLTNARRHGGPNASADVRLRYGPDSVEVEVSNAGRPPVSPRAGLGLVGMRERATASGGTLIATAIADGFLVRATLPTAPLAVS